MNQNINHPRYNTIPNAKMQRAMISLLRAVEALQPGQSLVVKRHANGVDIAHVQTEQPPPSSPPPLPIPGKTPGTYGGEG